MSDNHKHDYHTYYPAPEDHAYSVCVPALPGKDGDGATGELTVYASVTGAVVQEIGREYAGPWAYAVEWCGELYVHGDNMRSRGALTHERVALHVAEVASAVAESGPGGDQGALAERLAYFANGELPPEGFSWTKDSALWQVGHGERDTPRFISALDYLADHYAETPNCPSCGDVMDYCRRCA